MRSHFAHFMLLRLSGFIDVIFCDYVSFGSTLLHEDPIYVPLCLLVVLCECRFIYRYVKFHPAWRD
jgi:hypothetical protein